MEPWLEPGDIVFTRATGLFAAMLRAVQRRRGEQPTSIDHCGVVVVAGTVRDALIVEAEARVMRRTIAEGHANARVAVYRCVVAHKPVREQIAAAAERYVGRGYGYVKGVLHILDWAIGGRYVFRRFAGMDRYPICSWVVAHACAETGISFGVDVAEAQPDDIWDYVIKRVPASGWECVRTLTWLPGC